MATQPPTIHCPHCGKPMQVADVIGEGDTVIAVRYICGCKTPPYNHTVHSGQKGRPA